MDWHYWEQAAFSVLGREGSTDEGAGFIARLWQQANENFSDIAPHVVYGANGAPVRLWGLMSDMSRSLRPWENDFSRGLYLAGAECQPDAPIPEGWTKWDVPAMSYIRVPVQGDAGAAFSSGLEILRQQGLSMAAAAFDLTEPESGLSYVCFPVAVTG